MKKRKEKKSGESPPIWIKLRESENMKGVVSNYGQVRQSKFQTEQEVSGSISPPKIKTADCRNKDGLRLVACQDVLRLETPPGQLVAVQSKVEEGSGTFYLGGATLQAN